MALKPTQRVNVPDAVDQRATRVARSRTALVRVGVVQSVVGHVATVRVGGSATVKASFFVGAAYANGDVVALIADTDAFWVLGKLSKT